ncbi:MAG: hypothetical protein QM753_04245 [Thermomicrobiales bacterium]
MGKTGMQALVAVVGGLGAFAALFFMVLGPLISTPSPTGFVLAAALCYPLLMGASAVLGVFRFRLGLLAAVVAGLCVAIVIARYSGDESFSDLTGFSLIIAAPAILQAIVCGIGMFVTNRRGPHA